MEVISIEDLIDICAEYSGPYYYVTEMIPPKKLRNARVYFRIPANETVIALADTTIFGSCKTGFAIGVSGVYWKNEWLVKSSQSSLSWEELIHSDIKRISTDELEFRKGVSLGIYGVAINLLAPLLQQLQSYFSDEYEDENGNENEVESYSLPGNDVNHSTHFDQEEVWMVAVANQQYGPYSALELKNIIEEKQLRLSETFVWKQGMEQWVPVLKHKELVHLFVPARIAPMTKTLTQARALDVDKEVAQALDTGSLLNGNDASECIDINRASMEQLLNLPAIGVVGAKRIIQERERNGGFENVEQLGQLLDLKPHHVEHIRPMVLFRPLQQHTSTGAGRIVDY
ncbi:helix-hairpin-helix domain-containing protein [Paenibacillus sp. FSL H8-0537]|uniref:helix-hairpin-helix domain-containing protein n=1 Tax=Paenibacillus sp. FSL H8-0537 TaxID=2921399 RepID=UPI0031019FA2